MRVQVRVLLDKWDCVHPQRRCPHFMSIRKTALVNADPELPPFTLQEWGLVSRPRSSSGFEPSSLWLAEFRILVRLTQPLVQHYHRRRDAQKVRKEG